MTEPLISIQLLDRRRFYEPGELLSGCFQIDAVDPAELSVVELSVLWYTEGKGDEDLSVHHFERLLAEEHRGRLHELRNFRTQLPNTPLSYEGLLVKICWCVRVRAFLRRGKNVVSEQPFQLGRIPCAELVVP